MDEIPRQKEKTYASPSSASSSPPARAKSSSSMSDMIAVSKKIGGTCAVMR